MGFCVNCVTSGEKPGRHADQQLAEAVFVQYSVNARQLAGIRDMPVIQRQQVFYSGHGCSGNVTLRIEFMGVTRPLGRALFDDTRLDG
jgi:hypothetical protein